MAQPQPEEEYEDEFEEDEEEEEEGEEVEEVDADEPAGASVTGAAAAGAAAIEEEEEEQEEEDEEEEEQDDEEQDAQPWTGLGRLPEREDFISLFKELRASGKKLVTILLLGKSSVGKSSLVNALLGEAAVRVQAFKLQADTEITTPVVRQVAVGDAEIDGFKIKLIDTCGLEDAEGGDTVNFGALAKIAEDIRGVAIDVVLYVDRLDLYRVDPLDKAIMAGISQTFGRGIWRKTILVLTHSNMPNTPPGTTYDGFADRRIKLLRGGVRTLLFRPALPAVLAENSETCPTAPGSGHRVLPDGSEWAVSLLSEVADVAAARRPYKYHPRMTSKPSQRFRWLLPVVIAAQVVFYKKVLLPALEDNQRLVDAREELVWQQRARTRKALGLHPPHRPTKEAEWRLEQMYDDD